ncbi:MAG: SMP-30/gluconolactonase/LRE family protein [Proteobacteria bacterium]|nr:SMP-30/gluconolactonase/LRE family protein [Pseudomonadota bacterium]
MWHTLANSQSELGESPFWHPQERLLYWLDIPGRAVLRTRGDLAEGVVQRWALPTEPGCMAPARSGGLVIALRDGIYRAREWGGSLQRMTQVTHDVRTMRFNDGKCDALGRLWTGTINEAKDAASARLYCLDARGGREPKLDVMLEGVTTANGLAFAPDASTLYWADTPTHTVRAWTWQSEANQLSGERVFRRFDGKPPGWSADQPAGYGGRPDGASVDAQGRYWVAMYEGAQVLCLDANGTTVQTLPVPAQCPTMPCFGGDDLRTLFVTTGRHGRSSAELARLPASGSVLHTRVDAPGLPVNFFPDD